MRISADASNLEVNANIPISPTSVHLQTVSISGNSRTDPISIFVCGFETFSQPDASPYTLTIEVFSGQHDFDASSFFVNSHSAECPTRAYSLKMDEAGSLDLDLTLAGIFEIDSTTGVVVFQQTPTPVTGP